MEKTIDIDSRRGAGNAEVTGVVCKVSIVLIVYLRSLRLCERTYLYHIFVWRNPDALTES